MGIATAAIGAGVGIYQIVSANKQKQKAQKAIDDFNYSELSNAYEDMQVSKLGAEIIQEASGAATAQSVDALQKAGSRALAGGLGDVVRVDNERMKEASADLDRQQKEINLRSAEQDARNEAIREERERAELSGYGEMLNQARQEQVTGTSTLMEASMFSSQLAENSKAKALSKRLDKLEGVQVPLDTPKIQKPYNNRSWMGRRFSDVNGIFSNR